MKKKPVASVLNAQNALNSIQMKFQKLKEIQDQIAGMKQLYRDHDALVEELLPLFIDVTPDYIMTKRSITVGAKTYRFTPFFYDEKKGQLLPKVWKATCHESGRIGI